MFVRFWLLVFVLLSTALAWADSSGTDALKAVEKSIQMQQQAQNQADAWAAEKEELLSKVRNLQNQLRYLRYQQDKFASYSRQQEESIRRTEAKQQNLEKIQMELEPYLHKVVQQLHDFVQTDLPFLQEERQHRLAFLQETMADYHLSVSEKFRRVMEALQVEAEYGKYPEVTETLIELDGKTSKVQLLRLGRVALYYLSLDGQRAGRFNRATGQWEPLSADSAGKLKLAVQLVSKSRAMELVDLPVAR